MGEALPLESIDARIDVARQRDVAQALRAFLPARCVLWQEEDTKPFECDGLTAYRQLPMVVALPETEEQVQSIMRLCHAQQVPVVPRGAGTGLSGGALPLADGVLLSLAKFKRILNIDPLARIAVVQPGVRNRRSPRRPRLTACTTRPIPRRRSPARSAAMSRKTPAACTA